MTETNKKIIRIVYHTLITVALVTVAVLLMVACVDIYRMGDFPFTRELVAQHLADIALPIWLCLGLVAVGIVLHPLLPATPESNKDMVRMTAKRMAKRADLSLYPAPVAAAIRKEQSKRRLHRFITLGLLAVATAVVLVYALSFKRHTMEDINGSVIRAMGVLLPCVTLPGVYGVFSLFYNRKSYQREIALYRQVPAGAKLTPPEPKDSPWVRVVRYALLVSAIGLIVGGWLADGWVDVLTKAINICTECVGLG